MSVSNIQSGVTATSMPSTGKSRAHNTGSTFAETIATYQAELTDADVKSFFDSNPTPELIAEVAAQRGLNQSQILNAMNLVGYGGNDQASKKKGVEDFVANSANGYAWSDTGALIKVSAQKQAISSASEGVAPSTMSLLTGVAGAYQAWLDVQPNRDAGGVDVSFGTWRDMQTRDDLLKLNGLTLTATQKEMLKQADVWSAQGMPLQEQLDRAAAAGRSQKDIDTVLGVTRYHSKPDLMPSGVTGIKDGNAHNVTVSEAKSLLAIPLSMDPTSESSYGKTVTRMGLNDEQQAHMRAIRFGTQYFPTLGNVSGLNIDYAGNPIDSPMGGFAGAYNNGGSSKV